MKILISPAKGFKENSYSPTSIPVLIDETKKLVNILKDKSIDETMEILKVKKDIASLNLDRLNNFKYDINGMPALFSYDGLQYKNIGLDTFNNDDIAYCTDNLRILSGIYGILKPLDSIYPHRLDYIAKFKTKEYKNLYSFWSNKIANIIEDELDKDELILNLSSNEFLKSIEKYIDKNKLINCTFKVEKNGKFRVHSTASKMARGMIINYLVKNKIQTIEDVKKFDIDGYKFNNEESTSKEIVFCKYEDIK